MITLAIYLKVGGEKKVVFFTGFLKMLHDLKQAVKLILC